MSPRTASLTTTATGLRIGILHQRKPARLDAEALRLQAALLDQRTASPRPWFMRLIGRTYAWL